MGAANVATKDPEKFARLPERPLKLDNREPAALPICHCLFDPKAIEVDCDVNIFAPDGFQKLLKTVTPIFAKNGALALSIFHGTIVCPGMDFQSACVFGVTVAEDLVRPPAFKIPATPNAHPAHVRKLQCAIDPTAASPCRRTHVPIRVIVERNNN